MAVLHLLYCRHLLDDSYQNCYVELKINEKEMLSSDVFLSMDEVVTEKKRRKDIHSLQSMSIIIIIIIIIVLLLLFILLLSPST